MDEILYSDRYEDDKFEYRFVILPSRIWAKVPQRLFTEKEWRDLGIQQSKGWNHYGFYRPNKALLFKRNF